MGGSRLGIGCLGIRKGSNEPEEKTAITENYRSATVIEVSKVLDFNRSCRGMDINPMRWH
jgi:hypothetical protein